MSSFSINDTTGERTFTFSLLPVGAFWVPTQLQGLSDGQWRLYFTPEQESAFYASYDPAHLPANPFAGNNQPSPFYNLTPGSGGEGEVEVTLRVHYSILTGVLIYLKSGGTFYRGLFTACRNPLTQGFSSAYVFTGSLPSRERRFEHIGQTRGFFPHSTTPALGERGEGAITEWVIARPTAGPLGGLNHAYESLGSSNPLEREYPIGTFALSLAGAGFTFINAPILQMRAIRGDADPLHGNNNLLTAPGFNIVNWPPTASFVVTNGTLSVSGLNTIWTLEGMTAEFDASTSLDRDGTIVSYRWTIAGADGMTEVINTASPLLSYEFKTPGNQSVTLTVTDNDGATASSTAQVVAVSSPALTYDPHLPAIYYSYIHDNQLRVARNLNLSSYSTADDFLVDGQGGNLSNFVAFLFNGRLYHVYSRNGTLTSSVSRNASQTSATTAISAGLRLLAGNFQPRTQAFIGLAHNNSNALVRIALRQNGNGGWTLDTPTSPTGLPAAVQGGTIAFNGTTVLLIARDGNALKLYSSRDEGHSYSQVLDLATGHKLVSAHWNERTQCLMVLVRDSDGGFKRLLVRYSGGSWTPEDLEVIESLPDTLQGLALTSFATTLLAVSKNSSSLTLRKSTDEAHTFSTL